MNKVGPYPNERVLIRLPRLHCGLPSEINVSPEAVPWRVLSERVEDDLELCSRLDMVRKWDGYTRSSLTPVFEHQWCLLELDA